MSLNVQKFYDDTRKSEVKLVAGRGGLMNIVTGVHMIEREEISEFLEAGELVFTTGTGLEKERDLYCLVESISSKGASGMVINTGPFIHKIPEEIRVYCNEKDFPLFEVPWHIQMTKIMKLCMAEVMKSEQTQMELSAAMEEAIRFPERQEHYLPQLERCSLRSNWVYCVGILEISETGNPESNGNRYRRMAAEGYLMRNYPRTVITEMEGRFVFVFFNYVESVIDVSMKELAKLFFWNQDCRTEMFWGIGQAEMGIEKIGVSYRQALDVIDMKKRGITDAGMSLYRELGLYKILLPMKREKILIDFYTQYLQPLIHYDKTNKTDYLLLLECYFRNNGNINETSCQLYLHRNTINYKLNKIEKILHCDLSNMEDRTKLIIALMIYYIHRPLPDCSNAQKPLSGCP